MSISQLCHVVELVFPGSRKATVPVVVGGEHAEDTAYDESQADRSADNEYNDGILTESHFGRVEGLFIKKFET